jgi:protein PhnA
MTEYPKAAPQETTMAVKDSNGNELKEGDAVSVIKDLKVKGSSIVLKRGKVFKSIHLTDDEEEVECREGKSTLVLKACFLKKA